MSRARTLDDLARRLSEPMPRRRAVRLIGASLVAVAVPGVSPRIVRAANGSVQETCPDGSRCTDPQAPICCDTMKSPLSGNYVCRAKNQTCCCGNTACDTATQRCVCPIPGGIGGQCAPKCALEYGRGWKDCGVDCCAPYKTCGSDFKCHSCEESGKQTCSSYDNTSSHKCCKPGTKCCADMTATDCCGPKQTCKPAGRNKVTCKCNRTTDTKCGSDCCDKKKGESCCSGKKCCSKDQTCCGGVCCDAYDTCCDGECCDLTERCYVVGNVRGCAKKCEPPDTICGLYCCGPNTRCSKRKGKFVCV